MDLTTIKIIALINTVLLITNFGLYMFIHSSIVSYVTLSIGVVGEIFLLVKLALFNTDPNYHLKKEQEKKDSKNKQV